MKKIVTLFVVALMVLSISVGFTRAATKVDLSTGRNATYIAVRWAPVGYTWSGPELYVDKTKNFGVNGTYSSWGREGYRMPACTDDPLTGAVTRPTPNSPLYNVPATQATDSEPRFWAQFYLTVDPNGGESQEYDPMYAVLDNYGNVWFDKDGYFNDCRYYAFSDPADPLYNLDAQSMFDDCARNPKGQVDPLSSNNTQGPYPLMPTTETGAVNPGYIDFFVSTPGASGTWGTTGMGSTPMWMMATDTYEKDADGKPVKRMFRIGWVDMVDFPLYTGGADPWNYGIGGAITPTIVGGSHNQESWTTTASYWGIQANTWGHNYNDWDYNMLLFRFRDGVGANPEIGDDSQFFADPNDNWLHWGEEWHAENIRVNNAYDPGEWIYRAGQIRTMLGVAWNNAARNVVMGYDPIIGMTEDMGYGDQRLTPVSVHVKNVSGSGVTYNYAPGTSPIDHGVNPATFSVWDSGDDYDIGQMDRVDNQKKPAPLTNPRPLVRFRLSPSNFGIPTPALTPTQYDELHTDNISARGVGQFNFAIYDPYEHIYMKDYRDTLSGRLPNTGPRVEYGDLRLTNANSNAHPWAVQGFTGTDPSRLGGLWVGDVLIMAETLTAVCNDKDFYNLSVETDLWEGMIPSQTTAVLRSQVGEIQERAQVVNKSTVLGPTGTSFAVPATTFMDINVRSRQYLGVEIFCDNGRDNNLGVQHFTDNNGLLPDTERLYNNNISDDYRPGRTGEIFLGAQDANVALLNFSMLGSINSSLDYYMRGPNGKDAGRRLTRIDNLTAPAIRYLNPILNGGFYGCGMVVYADFNNDNEINYGDIRLTKGTFNRSGGIITYEAGSTVNPGDVDVNAWPGNNNDLTDFNAKLINGDYQYIMFYDDFHPDKNNPSIIVPPNGTFDPGEILYDTHWPTLSDNGVVPNSFPAYVQPGFTRMTPGWVGDTYYDCGSIVPPFDFWLQPSTTYGVTSGLNCDARFLDWEVIPGNIRLNVVMDKPLKVEQTSDIIVTVDPPPRKGYWEDKGDHQVWVPDEQVYVIIREPGGIALGKSDTNLWQQFKVLTADSPKATFTVTPYRGSCSPNRYAESQAQTDAMKLRIQAFKSVSGVFPNKVLRGETIMAPPDQHRGFQSPTVSGNNRLETRHFYRDLFYTGDWRYVLNRGNHWGKKLIEQVSGFRAPGFFMDESINKGEDLIPSPPLPPMLAEQYDCFGEAHFEVAPELINIEPNVACITTLDQRFPNMTLKLKNYDNPDDVNDPHDVTFSVPQTDTPLIATYNAHGGGVDWLGVAEIANPRNGEKIIFQANIDGTYEYWYWYEPINTDPDLGPQIPNAIDPNDVIIGQPWNGAFPLQCTDSVNRPGIYVDSRSNWTDADCSAQVKQTCPEMNYPLGMKPIGEVTGYWGRPQASDKFGSFDGGFGWIVSYGVPTYVTPFGDLSQTDDGGSCQVVVDPKDGSTHMQIYVYLTRAIFDYNSTIAHPMTGSPYFRHDESFGQPQMNPAPLNMGSVVDGIDYAGAVDLKVYPPDPYVNFAEWLIVDKGLMYSQTNYTTGPNSNPPLSQLPPPAPQIQSPYWPILRTSHGGFRCYPGGQTHTGRVLGQNFNQLGGAFGWNAYPAIWSEDTQRDVKAERFYKLGTEFFPLTDYGIYFILKDGEGNHLSFTNSEIDRKIKRLEIVGPYARPKVTDTISNSVVSGYQYNGLTNVPINYDYSGKLVIDETNWKFFEHSPGIDYMNKSVLGDVSYGTWQNRLIKRTQRLNYCSLNNVFVIDEIIPWNYGKIYLYVTLADGTFKMYQDCCTAPPVDGIDSRALEIKQVDANIDPGYEPIDKFTLGAEEKVSFIVKEHEWEARDWGKDIPQLCNDAVMFMWQDRGVYDPRDTMNTGITKLKLGAGDGWVTLAPTSSRAENVATQFIISNDLNGDGRISFNDWETEILGTYTMATNTWRAGVIDARTFQRNNGRYDFELTKDNGCMIDTIGFDFGGEEGVGDPQDHIISDKELLPIYATAYKYGDDNNDRSFGPWWDFDAYYSQYNVSINKYDRTRYSHEVYIAGQVAISIEPFDDLIVSYTPNPLTAGITPELISVDQPLTFVVKDKDGKPFDLTQGILDPWGQKEVKSENVWNMLFKDPHPDNTYYYGRDAKLPQYYFLRTDLHNYDRSEVNNRELYSTRTYNAPDCEGKVLRAFEPIEFTSDAKAGMYVFKGFCANDNNTWIKDPENPDKEAWEQQHKFRVYVYSPDRTHRGFVDVQIVNPKVTYFITNTEDPQLRTFDVPGEPDFIMTAADNRIYRVEVTVSNAQGQLVKGVTKGVSVCGGGVKNTARFTPFVTRPQSFDYFKMSCDYAPCAEVIYPHFGFDFNGDGQITWEDQEVYTAGSFFLDPNTNTCFDRQGVGEVFYNTTNKYFENDQTWAILNETGNQRVENIVLNLPPPEDGWGLGAIYNWPYYGGFLFNDFDKNQKLDFHDALGLDVNAQTSFYLFAEDLLYVGGLVGNNKYCNDTTQADLAGYPNYNDKANPRYMIKRFRYGVSNDTTFKLDWEAIPDRVAQVSYPRIDLFYAETGNEVSKELLNVDNYDMVYNVENHFIARIYPAFKEDLPLKGGARLYVGGNKHQQAIYGTTRISETDSQATETTIHYTPDGTGQAVAYLNYMSKNKWYMKQPYQFKSPEWFVLKKIYTLDVGKGLEVIIDSLDQLAPNAQAELVIAVREIGTLAPVADAKVNVEGPGINQTPLTTNAKGEVKVKVTPNAGGKIVITADKDEYISGKSEVMIGKDTQPPKLEVNPIVPFTNVAAIDIKGKTEPGVKVLVNGQMAKVEADGSFSAKVTLVEGANTISIEAIDGAGNRTTALVSTVLDKTEPKYFFNNLVNGEIIVDKETTVVEISGRVEEGTKVLANGAPVDCPYDIFKTEVTFEANLNEMTVTFDFIDKAGNKATAQVKLVRK
jgi:hypothetical protein